MSTRNRLALAALLAAVCGCGGCGHSPPTRFYELASVPPAGLRRELGGDPVQVQAVRIPGFLDRTELVSRGGQERLDIHDQQHWGGPLDQMIRRVLSEDLAARLPHGMVLDAQAPGTPTTRGIVLDIDEFEPLQGGSAVVLDAHWLLVAAGHPQPLMRRDLELRIEAGHSTDAQVDAMDRLLARVADDIAAQLH